MRSKREPSVRRITNSSDKGSETQAQPEGPSATCTGSIVARSDQGEYDQRGADYKEQEHQQETAMSNGTACTRVYGDFRYGFS